jgi:hypothetical protein
VAAGRGLPCLILVIWGFRDPTAEFEAGKLLFETYMRKQPQAELRIFNTFGHFVFRE